MLFDLVPDPLHPAVAHLPMALAVLAPLAALLGALAIGRRWLPARAWLAVVGLQVLLALSAWASLETGEDEEERVERVVSHDVLHEHEEKAELFLVLAGVTAGVALAGLAPAGAGAIGRAATVVATLVVLGAGVRVGHSGGELVYRHGAAAAYAEPDTGAGREHAGHGEYDD